MTQVHAIDMSNLAECLPNTETPICVGYYRYYRYPGSSHNDIQTRIPNKNIKYLQDLIDALGFRSEIFAKYWLDFGSAHPTLLNKAQTLEQQGLRTGKTVTISHF